MTSTRRSLMMPDELWSRVRAEAAQETLTSGQLVSSSAVVREAVALYLAVPREVTGGK